MAKSELQIRMEQDRCMEAIDEAIKEVEAQLDELGSIGSDALESGDQAAIDTVMESICFINQQLTDLKRMKVNARMQVVTSHISSTMVGVLGMLSKTAVGTKMPNTKKLMKIQQQLAASTASTKAARKQISSITSSSNPASKAYLSDDQRAQAMMFIQSRRVSKTGSLGATATAGGTDVWSRANAEKGTTN